MSDIENFIWCEKYRPKTIEDCILPETLKSTFQEYVAKKEIPNLILVGTQGSGKTTVAKALCNEVGCDYLFLNGSSENGIDTFRTKITNYASSVSLSGGKKVIIIDEADYMNANSLQPALRQGIEAFHKNCSFIFTANFGNRIIAPLHSRCSTINFSYTKQDKLKLMTDFLKRVCTILENENVTYDKKVVASLINKYFPDNRKILNELQRYSVNGTIDVGILSQAGDLQLKDLIKYLKDKDFSKTREWVVANADNDPTTLFRKIYDGLYEFLVPSCIPHVVLILAKYQYQIGFVSDPEIQILAFLTELMVDAEFK